MTFVLFLFLHPLVFNIKTIEDLAHWKYFKIARAIVALKNTEQKGKRDVSSKANINKALDKEYEKKSLAVSRRCGVKETKCVCLMMVVGC